MKTAGLFLVGLLVVFIGWKILSAVIFPFIIPIVVIGGIWYAVKKGFFKKFL